MKIRLLSALAAAFLAAAARGEGRREAAGLTPALSRELSARASERGMPPADALAPVAEASRRGLPADLVASKVLEGLSKGVPPPRILAVARELTERLGRADAFLARAARAGVAPPGDHRAALLDLSAASASGVGVDAQEALLEAARKAGSGSAEAVVSAAQALGECNRRGVPVQDAMALGLAIARRGPRPAGEVAALLDAWRAEGGKDASAFVSEAARRVESGRKLEGMVDSFGETPDRVVVDRGARRGREQGLADTDVGKHGAAQGLTPGERSESGGRANSGLEDIVHGKGKDKGPKAPKK